MRKMCLAIAAATMTMPVATPAPAFAADGYQRDRGDRGYYSGRTWRDRQGRLRCRRSDGTTGLIVGGAAGALIGREVAGRGDKTLGTIVGAAGGALVGREIDRGRRVRCR